MKRFVILFALMIFSVAVFGQWVHSANDQMSSFNWGVIDMILFRKTNDTTVIPVYTDDVTRFENRHFKLTGYMIPTKAGMKQTQFMISTLPINQCYFCGKNGNPIMVVVNTRNPVKFSFKVVTVEGTLKLSRGNAFFVPAVSLVDAYEVAEN